MIISQSQTGSAKFIKNFKKGADCSILLLSSEPAITQTTVSEEKCSLKLNTYFTSPFLGVLS
jgi:hypothetical protein